MEVVVAGLNAGRLCLRPLKAEMGLCTPPRLGASRLTEIDARRRLVKTTSRVLVSTTGRLRRRF